MALHQLTTESARAEFWRVAMSVAESQSFAKSARSFGHGAASGGLPGNARAGTNRSERQQSRDETDVAEKKHDVLDELRSR